MTTETASWRRGGERALFGGLVCLVGVLSLFPIARLLWEGFFPGGTPSLAAISTVLAAPNTWVAFRNSLEVSAGGTALAVLIGTLVAIVVSVTDMRARNAFVFCFVLPLMIAPQVTALAWLQATGPSSPVLKLIGLAPPIGTRNPLYSREGIILLLGVQYAPLVFLTMRAGMRSLPRELIEAGLSSGARRLTVLRTIVLPLMTPPLVAGTALAFVSCVGNLGIPLFLGIPGRYPVLTTLIYQRLAGLGPSVLSELAILSMLVGLIATAGILVQEFVLRRRDFNITSPSAAAAPFDLRGWRLPLETLLWSLSLFVLVLPLLGLLLTSLGPGLGVPLNFKTVTLANYAFVLFEHSAARRAIVNSIGLSLSAALLIALVSIPLGYFIVWKRTPFLRVLNVLTELPYALPGVVLAIASILMFLKPVPVIGLVLYNTIWIILFAYLARFLVLGLRPIVNSYYQLDRSLEEAAQVAGASLIYRLRTVIFPLLAPAAMAGAILIFLTAFSELTVSALLWSSQNETLGVLVFSFEQGGDSNNAAAVAMMTVAVTLLLMLSMAAMARRLPAGVLPWRD
jgi:iron(III) transport system permease protein